MRYGHLLAVIVTVLMFCAGRAGAQLVYSYETLYNAAGQPDPTGTRPDGFFGLGAAVSQSTIGATHLTHSMRYSVPAGQTFVGARTESVLPPGLTTAPAIQFDLHIDSLADEYQGAGFARIGITYFGHDFDSGQFGLQVQTNGASEQNIDLAAGNYTLTIPLVATDGQTFAQHFDNSEPADLDAISAFQFYVSKTGDSGVTMYIDNVQIVPEPASLSGLALGSLLLGRRRSR
jgi:hypothetical protein